MWVKNDQPSKWAAKAQEPKVGLGRKGKKDRE